jgi:hypothetical protein
VQQPIALKINKKKIAAVMSSRTAAMENLKKKTIAYPISQQTTSSDCSVGTHYDSGYSRSAVYN